MLQNIYGILWYSGTDMDAWSRLPPPPLSLFYLMDSLLLACSVQFSPLTNWVDGSHDRQFLRDLLPVLSAESPCKQFWHGQEYPLFDVVHQALPLPNRVSSTLQGALTGGLGEAVMACDMPKPCKFFTLDSCQKRFLWTQKEVDVTPHPVVGLVLQVGDMEKFPHAYVNVTSNCLP